MRFFCDAEFNGHGGDLISLALVPQERDWERFYVELPLIGAQPWVQQNVVPHLIGNPLDHETAAKSLATFLGRAMRRDGYVPIIVADWPPDLAYFLWLLNFEPGKVAAAAAFRLDYRNLPGFAAREKSAKPHFAPADAEALRDFFVEHNLQ